MSARQRHPSRMPAPTEPRAVVSWEGTGQPIMLALYGRAGVGMVPMVPKRALALTQGLLTDFTRSNDGVRSEDAQILRSC